MSQPTVIIELQDGSLKSLYANQPVSFIIVNRDDNPESTVIDGPYAPTLETHNLRHAVEGIDVPPRLLAASPSVPYF